MRQTFDFQRHLHITLRHFTSSIFRIHTPINSRIRLARATFAASRIFTVPTAWYKTAFTPFIRIRTTKGENSRVRSTSSRTFVIPARVKMFHGSGSERLFGSDSVFDAHQPSILDNPAFEQQIDPTPSFCPLDNNTRLFQLLCRNRNLTCIFHRTTAHRL